MSLILKILTTIPPGGWTYIEPKSGLLLRGGDYYKLREAVRQHRDNNRFENGPQLDHEIQTQICERITAAGGQRAKWCIDPATIPIPGPSNKGRSIHIDDVRSFLRLLGTWMKSGFKFIEQPEANRRAGICASCPQNVDIQGCSTCAHIGPLLTQTIGRRTTTYDSGLKGCEVCGCSNKAQIWVPLKILKENMKSPQLDLYPNHCWKLEGN